MSAINTAATTMTSTAVHTTDDNVVTRDGRAMGSALRVVVVGGEHAEALADRAVRRVAELEARWSRFRPDSDISRLNLHAGEVVEVHPDTVALVVAMVQAWRATAGAFDPTLLGALVGLGYAASWEDPTRRSVLAPTVQFRGDPDQIEISSDATSSAVLLPVGTAVDPGGIGKGLAADIVVGDLLGAGAAGVLVSLGGDLRVAGRAPQSGGWAVGIDDPASPGTSRAQVRLLDGGVATSGTDRRRWTIAGHDVDHLLDPRTGRPAHHGDDGPVLVGATVIAGTAAWAEAWTKAVMVLGVDAAFEVLERHHLAASAVHDDGSTRATSAWAGFAAHRAGDTAADTAADAAADPALELDSSGGPL